MKLHQRKPLQRKLHQQPRATRHSPTPHPSPPSSTAPLNTLVTYYFENFPNNWNHSAFRSLFSKYLTIINIYISPCLNRSGSRFGFFKVANSPSVTQSIKLIAALWIGDKKLHIQLARRPKLFPSHTQLPSMTSIKPNQPSSRLKDSRTYVEVTKEGPRPNKNKAQTNQQHKPAPTKPALNKNHT